MKSLILTVDDLRAVADEVGLDSLMDQTIAGIESVCLECRDGDFVVPSRAGFPTDDGSVLEWMPVLRKDGHAAMKIVGYHPTNPRLMGLPTILSVAVELDTATGHLLTLADATFTTALRTGAASAVASRVLASETSRTLGLIGAGAQALTQLHALSRLFELERVLIFDIDPSVTGTFASRARRLGLTGVSIEPAAPDVVAQHADILCTATSVGVGDGPVFADHALQPHLHVNAVGADLPGKREVPESLLARSFIAVDFMPQAMQEGECQRLERAAIGPELVPLVQGASQYSAYRNRPTVFDSTGFALEDFVVLDILHKHADALGRGTLLEIESVASDPLDPYSFLNESTGVTGIAAD